MYRLGIDVGGTHVDFALVDRQDKLVYGCKSLVEIDTVAAIIKGIKKLQQEFAFNFDQLSSIHVGTTLAVNSLLELKSLYKVGLLRLAGHNPDLPPAYLWPKAQRDVILAGYETVAGGREYNNVSCRPLNPDEIIAAVKKLIAAGAESLALIGVFSSIYAEDELLAADIIQNQFSIPMSLSHELGGIGFIERENATILNATLKKVLTEGLSSLKREIQKLGYQGECLISQNNGTVFSLEEAMRFPVKTISSGPTNSLVGASKLAQCLNAIVVDIGGTSTDIGIVENGFPVYSSRGGLVAGISSNLVTPDIVALAIGGGSIIRKIENNFSIGPDSVGAALFNRCQSHGGPDFTFYDVSQSTDNPVNARIMADFIDQIKTAILTLVPKINKPILFVGGGSRNIPDRFFDENVYRPQHFEVANAYGAALSEVSGQVDCIIKTKDRESQLSILESEAKSLAIKKGAVPSSIRIIEKRILPLFYMQEPMLRILVTASGKKA